MIKNFEEITVGLTARELNIIPIFIKFISDYDQSNPIKASKIVAALDEILEAQGLGIKMNEVRVRKCSNHIRTNSLLPLIATSKGYFVSYDQDVIAMQIQSLYERAEAVNASADGLSLFVNNNK